MDFLIDGVKYSIVGGVFWFIVRSTLRRYHWATLPDSNAPNGRRVDWDLFFNRKP